MSQEGEVKFKSNSDMKDRGVVTGYDYSLINAFCSKYTNLWEERDDYDSTYLDKGGRKRQACIMTDRYYISHMIKRLKYMTKKHVNVPLFEQGKKAPCQLFGKNYMSYTLRQDEETGTFEFSFTDPTSESEGRAVKKFNASLAKNGYLNNLKIVESSNKDGVYKVSFNTAVENKDTLTIQTTYTGYIKEPRIRFNLEKNVTYLDLCISGIESDNDTFNKILSEEQKENKEAIFKGFSSYFKASYAKGRDGSQKGSLDVDVFRAMGVDLGLNPLAALSIYEVKKSDKGEDIGGQKVKIKHLTDHKSSDINKANKDCRVKKAKRTLKFIEGVKGLISVANHHCNYLEDVEATGEGKEVNVGYMEMLCGDVIENHTPFKDLEDYMKYIENNLYGVDRKEWKKKTSDWVVPSLIQQAKKKISEMRREYFDAEDKHYHTTKVNHVCNLQLHKIQAVKEMISTLNSFSTLGLNDEEKQAHADNGRPCADLWEYINGLRNYLSKGIASIIINHALRNSVNIIFIEDLDMKASSFDSKEENKLKSLWSASQIMDYLEKFAAKHTIAVQEVNKFMTSQFSSENGTLGVRGASGNKSQFLYEDKGEVCDVDSDINAARNIAIRGITRHSNMPMFKVKVASDKEFILEMPKAAGMQKLSSMMKYLDSDNPRYVKFVKANNGTLKASVLEKEEFNKLKKQAIAWKKDNKDADSEVSILRSGKHFYIRKELEAIVKAKLCPEVEEETVKAK